MSTTQDAIDAGTMPTAADETRPVRLAGRTEYRLSFNQREMWVLCQLHGGSALHNMAVEVAITGRLDPDAFDAAFQAVVDRHEALRTAFPEVDGSPVQRIAAIDVRALRRDISELAAPEQTAYVRSRADALARMPFALDRAPLFRAELIRLVDDRWVFVFAFHNLILDGFHLPQLLEELATTCERFQRGDRTAGAPLALQFGDFAEWEHRRFAAGQLTAHEGYWRAQLQPPLPSMTTTADWRGPTARTFETTSVTRRLSPDLSARVRRLARRWRTTTFRAVTAAFEVVWWRLTGERDVLVATPFSLRPNEMRDAVGFFGNTLPLRSALDPAAPFEQLVATVTAAVRDTIQHREFPLTELFRSLDQQRDANRPLMPVCVAQVKPIEIAAGDLRLGAGVILSGGTAFDFSLLIGEDHHEIELQLAYATELFREATADTLLAALETILAHAVEQPHSAAAHLRMLGDDDGRQVAAWGAGPAATDEAAPTLLDELVAAVARTPHAPAVIANGATWTYRDLERAWNRVAAALAGAGVGREARVGILGTRGPGMVAAAIGILRAGAAFVPLDASHPDGRLHAIAGAATLTAIVTDRQALARTRRLASGGPSPLPVLSWDDLTADPSDAEAPPVHSSGRDLAYIYFTSGSTGAPKGAMVEHRGLRNHLRAKIGIFDLDATSVVVQNSSYGFDIVVWQWLAPLLAGGRVLIYDEATAEDPAALLIAMERDAATLLETVPSFLEALLEAADAQPARRLPALRWLLSQAEMLPPAVARRWIARFPAARLVNGYGPTECSDDTMHGAVDAAEVSDTAARVDIGHPIPGSTIFVVDERLEPLPPGFVGEIVIGGIAVGRGYLGNPAQTARAFVPDPRGTEPGARLYRTGDRGRWRTDGRLECLGRQDDQIKLHGYRVELGDVEAALADLSALSQVAAAVRTDGHGQRRLVAYYVAPEIADAASVRRELAARLPAHMVPSALVRLDALPRTATGKLDRLALPVPPTAVAADAAAPASPLEAELAAVWCDVLRLDAVGRHDNFFDLGGDSIQCIRVVSRLNQRGCRLSPRAVFAHQTIADLARLVEQTAAAAPATARPAAPDPAPRRAAAHADAEDVYPLAPIQEGMLFHAMLEPESSLYYEQVQFALEGPIDVSALQQAWDRLVAHHPVLRTVIRWEGLPEPVQVVLPHRQASIAVVDLSSREPATRETAIAEATARDWAQRFVLDRGPLVRLTLFTLGEGSSRFVWTFHHILLDGWSGTSLLRDLATAYADCANGRAAAIAPVPRYGDFLAWLRRQDRTAARTFWRRQLAGFVAPTPLPRDRPAGQSRRRVGARIEHCLTPGMTRAIEQRARGERVTMSALVRTAWAVVLARTSGGDDIVFGATVSGRPTELDGVEQMVGPFINAVPVRVRVARAATIGDLVKGIQAQALETAAFEYLPLTDVQAAAAIPADTQLFDSLVAYENFPVEERPTAIGDARLAVRHSRELTHYDLTLYAVPSSQGLQLHLAYAPDLFDGETARRLLDGVVTVLAAGAADPQARAWDLPLVSTDDAARLAAWGDGGPGAGPADVGRELAIVAARRAASIALTAGADEWTYGRLQAGADAMHAALAALGAGREHRVGILGTRSPGMVATVIGTLQTGAAFVPLDTGHPDARLRTIAAAAGLTAIATDRAAFVHAQRLVAALPAPAPVVVCWDDAIAARTTGDTTPCQPAAPADLAYIFHTSGSTGTPKGVMVERAALWNHLQAKRAALALETSSVVAQTASSSFDIVVWQWLSALLAGGRVVIYDDVIAEDPSLLLAALAGDRVTVVETVPSFLETLIEAAERPGAPALPDLQWMISNAEALPAAVAGRWRTCYPATRLLNTYGATECGDDTTQGEVPLVVSLDERVTVGCPIPGVMVAVVDDHMRLVPPGVAGQILLGGVAVGRGYLGDPAATASAFLPDPWSRRPGARLYRTGDRGRWRADGQLECLGRTDQQIKVRGHRVELAEIEAALAAIPGLSAVAAAVHVGGDGRARLVGYYAAATAYDVAALRRDLGLRVPAYMVPEAFVRLDALPRTRTGKLDRAALPPPSLATADPEAAAAATTPLEATIAAVWQQILGVDRVGRNDNFFDLGGHSLSAIRIVAALKDRLGRRVPIRQLLAGPTVTQLAAAIGGDTTETPPVLAPVAPRAWYPLSAAQRSQWIAQHLSAGEEWYSPRVLQLDGALDRAALSAALQALVVRHDALRTTFRERDGDVVQVVAEHYELPWQSDDLSASAAAAQAARVQAILEEESRRPFTLGQLPLLELRLVRLAAERHLLIFRMPHIVTDGWSEGILATDLAELYNAHRGGRPPVLPALPLRHVDVCAGETERLRTAPLQAQKAYWLNQFNGDVPMLQLPRQATGGGEHRTAYASGAIGQDAIERLRQLAAAHGVTLFVVMLGVFEVLLARISGQSDFVVATPIAGRGRPELARITGLFANLLPLRSSLAGNPTFADVLTRISRTTMSGLANQDYPFHHWVEERRRTSSGLTRLFSAFFVMHEEAFHPAFDGVSTQWFSAEAFGASLFSRSFPWYPQSVGFYANDAGSGWRVTMVGDSSAFADAFLKQLLEQWLAIAGQVAADPQRRVAAIELPGTGAAGVSYATVALDGDDVEQLFA